MTADRPAGVEPYLRGAPFPPAVEAPYPRSNPADARLPGDTRAMSLSPAGVRLELVGDVASVRLTYSTTTEETGFRGAEFGRHFSAWAGSSLLDEQPAELGEHTLELRVADTGDRTVIHLPEAMNPTVLALEPVGGSIEPAPAQPRWVAYGDSITEGWIASSPAGAWPAMAGRQLGLDVVNMGYAGSARGELVSADHVAAVPADVVSLAFGTNCWTMVPFTYELIAATTSAFLKIVRSGHPTAPIVVVSPIRRPDAEATPNRVGATLADLRAGVEDAARGCDDERVTLVPGADLLDPGLLADGVHPGDEGHRVMADSIGSAVARALAGASPSS